ncbi:MAG: response regulator [Desulfamplus sp.]|nr:response regulator [Desulfamplus sp.]
MKILVVDDNKMERFLLTSALKSLGYDIFEAVNGNEALSLLESKSINLVISDWMMPGMDGIELCQYIRLRKNTDGYVYVIMVTSKSEEEDLMKGFEAGVDAYLQKPITIKILDVQIKVGMRIINLEQQLTYEKQKVSRFADEMESLAKHRAEQLIHADRMASLGVMAAGIAHEINNPATFINGNIQTFEKFWPLIEKSLASNNQDNQMAFIVSEMPSLIDGIKSGTARIQRILKGLKSYARQDSTQFIEYELHKIIDDALLLCHNNLKYNITIIKDFMKDIPSVECDPQKIEQVFVNIFNNAADAMENMNKGTIKITTRTTNHKPLEEVGKDSHKDSQQDNQQDNQTAQNHVKIVIDDTGHGLSHDILRSIWDPFFTTKPVGKGTGLGMSISHGIIKAHQGTIKAENRPEGGARFTITLPIYSPK